MDEFGDFDNGDFYDDIDLSQEYEGATGLAGYDESYEWEDYDY